MDIDGGGEDCAELVLLPFGKMRTPGYWNDRNCADENAFICETHAIFGKLI